MDSRGTQTYGYDPANQLNDAEISGSTTSYIYNGHGVRTARETSSTYIEYVMDVNRSLPVILYDETAFYVWGLDLIARIVGSTQQYYHYDGLGSTRALTSNNGTTLATYNYDVFGVIRSQTGSQPNNFLFTGEWRDSETGFYFLRARYYDPVVGRFINRDPWSGDLMDPQSLNRYTYVANNPLNLVDPSGKAFAVKKEPTRYGYRDCDTGSEDECLSGGGNPSGAGPTGWAGGWPGFWERLKGLFGNEQGITRGEQFARKIHMNPNSPTTKQLMDNLDMKVTDYISKHRKASIRTEFPSEYFDKTVEQALLEGGSKVRKLLTEGRWVK